MAINLDVSSGFCSPDEIQSLREAAEVTLKHESVSERAGVSIVISDNDDIQALNRQFRHVDAPTDVLAFPAEFSDPESGVPYLGDVIISYPRAETQASQRGHNVESELQLLVVHGVLHLLGYDHADPGQKERMWATQADILDQLGLGDVTPSD
jgi:probable rRNA maturation factor